MIARLIAWVRDLRITHYDRTHQMHGGLMLDAQRRADWPATSRHWDLMRDARDKRDALAIQRRKWEIKAEAQAQHPTGTCPPCNHDCYEGHACPARAR